MTDWNWYRWYYWCTGTSDVIGVTGTTRTAGSYSTTGTASAIGAAGTLCATGANFAAVSTGAAGTTGTAGASGNTGTASTTGADTTGTLATAAVSVWQLHVSSSLVCIFSIFSFLLCCNFLKAVMVHSSHSDKAPSTRPQLFDWWLHPSS